MGVSRNNLTALKTMRLDLETGRAQLPLSHQETSDNQRSHIRNLSHVQSILQDVIEAANPGIHHLASHSSIGSQELNPTRSKSKSNRGTKRLSTNFEDQRIHKLGLSLTKNTKIWEPSPSISSSAPLNPRDSSTTRSDWGNMERSSGGSEFGSITTVTGPEAHDGGIGSIIAENPSTTTLQGGNSDQTIGNESGEEDELQYPGTFGVICLIFGIALSVFLISLDRTIITTVSSWQLSIFPYQSTDSFL
jgi:hypothetical protein